MRLVLILLLIASYSYAQETHSDYELLGFSDDLKYIAFETHSPPPVDDAEASSKIVFVEVEKNSWATKPLLYSGDVGEAMDKVILKNKAKAQSLLAKFHIVPGKIPGERVNLVTAPDSWGRNIPTDRQVFVIDKVKYTLELKSVETGEEHEALMIPKYKMELTVTYNGKTQVLQKDNTVPASRGFTTGYSILGVYYSGLRLVVFLEYRQPGFEGSPDTYNMVVTGVLGK